MKSIITLVSLLFAQFCINIIFAQSTIFKSTTGKVSFTSDAPLEVISASSKQLAGVIKTTDKSFAFKIPMNTFEGFNSAMQKTHFNENYIETDQFPYATFEGKIIEDIDFTVSGTIQVRGKGTFSVHGVSQVRIIKCKLTIASGKITIESNFSVFLQEHDIEIPSVVNQKIAEEIIVTISAVLEPLKQ